MGPTHRLSAGEGGKGGVPRVRGRGVRGRYPRFLPPPTDADTNLSFSWHSSTKTLTFGQVEESYAGQVEESYAEKFFETSERESLKILSRISEYLKILSRILESQNISRFLAESQILGGPG